MNVLLTGHKGFIGTQLYKRLQDLKFNVIGIDLQDGNDLLTCELPIEVDFVIHLAGKSGVRQSLNDPAGYWTNNIEASKRLFERYKGKRILYASSSSQYEPHLNPYAASKHCLEYLASCYPFTLGMRLHTVYSDIPRKDMFFDKLQKGTLEYVTNHTRDFIHMEDVLDAIQLLVYNPEMIGVIDIGTGNSVRVRDLAPNLPVKIYTPNERHDTLADITQLKKLGFTPKHLSPRIEVIK
jgi:nucleoside-diphosphate-sugar epimerase